MPKLDPAVELRLVTSLAYGHGGTVEYCSACEGVVRAGVQGRVLVPGWDKPRVVCSRCGVIAAANLVKFFVREVK